MKIFNKKNILIIIIFIVCVIFEFSMGALYGRNTIDPNKPRTCTIKVRISDSKNNTVEEKTTDEVILSEDDRISEII